VKRGIASLGCYNMYASCLKLTKTPKLKAGAVYGVNNDVDAGGCYYMFGALTGVIEADSIVIGTIGNTHACANMFQGCTKLQRIPIMKIGKLGNYCFYQQFYECTALTMVADTLYNTTLANGCYCEMFDYCSAITDNRGLVLPATTLAPNCYHNMFYKCTGMTTTWDNLEVDVVGTESCLRMYQYCTKLAKAPSIVADSIAPRGCKEMFLNCGASIKSADDSIVARVVAANGLTDIYKSCTALTKTPKIKIGTVMGTATGTGGCYYMFNALTGITSADRVVIDSIGTYGCEYMFTGATKLATLPKIKVRKLGNYCFSYAFNGCTALELGTDTLFNTTLADHCYEYMFNGCTKISNLTNFILPADTIAPYAYSYMFSGCTGITTMMDTLRLPIIGDHGCQYMMNGCNNLKRSASLLTDSIGYLGCLRMFASCGTKTATADSMTAGDIIVKKAIYNQGCQEMFSGCTKLKKTPDVYAGRVMSGNATKTGGCYYMFYLLNVPRMGKLDIKRVDSYGCELICYNCSARLAAVDTIRIDSLGAYGLSSAFSGCAKITKIPKILVKKLDGSYNMQYMFNGCTSLTFNNDTLYNKQLTDYCYNNMFASCSGLTNIAGLHIAADTLASYACYQMFNTCGNMTSTMDTLKFKVIGNHSCDQMFTTCKKLASSPVIHVDSIGVAGCYRMFYNCSTSTSVGLSSAGNIVVNGKIASLGCNEMFGGCGRLTKAPSVFAEEVMSNGTTATGGCYNMFASLPITSADYLKIDRIDAFGCEQMYYKCTALTKMDSIIIQDSVGTQGCYNMFSGCTNANFTQAPKIKANKVGYRGLYNMYVSCINFTSSDSILAKDINNQGCYKMFEGCTKLASLPHMKADSIGEKGCSYMFTGCTLLAIVKDTLPTLKLGPNAYEYMFNGCVKITDVSQFELSATQLAPYCYFHMFEGCTGLTDVSSLKMRATNLAPYCYNNMFGNCTNLTTAWDTIKVAVIGEQSCAQMFNTCKKLNAAPAIKADSIGPKGCYQMFLNCSTSTTVGLKSAGDIVVNGKVASLGLNNMYNGCHLLTTAPNMTIGCVESNGTAATGGCYQMFSGLTGMTQAGYLRAGTIEAFGCQLMFTGCSKLAGMESIRVDSIGQQGCYQMFYNDAKFANAPKLTADIIGQQACYQMLNCTTAIASADTIRAKKVYEGGLQEMFNGCKTLAAVPYIRLDTVGRNGCKQMFNGCWTSATVGVQTIDSVIIDKMGPYACQSMFEGCKRLATVKTVKNTQSIDEYACNNMFKTCTLLVDVRDFELQSQFLSPHCYDNMFYGCSALEHPMDTIKANTIGEQACCQMFNTCAKLRRTPAITVDSIGQWGCKEMFKSCNTSTAVDSLLAQDIRVKGTIYLNGCTDMFNSCSRLRKAASLHAGKIAGTYGTSESAGDGGCYRMYNTLYGLKDANYMKVGTIDPFGCFFMCYNCTTMVKMDSIRVDSIAYRGTHRMFESCKAMKTAPKLVAQSIANQGCYWMYYSRSTITSADSIIVGTIHNEGCREMYSGCTGLLTQNPIRVDSIGEKGCYMMFSGCTKLNQSPKIEVGTIGKQGCYQMFNGCYSSATQGLRRADSIIVARGIGERGCEEMFKGCQRMDTIRAILTTKIGRNGCLNMFQNCFKANTGTAKRYAEGFGETGTVLLSDSACRLMFNTCTYLDSCADLRFSTIGARACNNMFNLCNGMDVTPAITAQKVKDYGCYQMFSYDVSSSPYHYGFERARDIHFAEVGNHGCYQMFYQCRNMVKAPNLTITKVGAYGCYQMFLNSYYNADYGMDSVGTFNIQEIGTYGCAEMFSGCQSLEESPAILATTIASHGCEKMFYNCYLNASVGLKRAGKIETNTIGMNGLTSMYEGCKRLDSIQGNRIVAEYIDDYGCLKMFYGCSALPKALKMEVKEMGKYTCQYMYSTATGLTAMPQLPTMRIGDYCYSHMFDGCTALRDTTSLPVTAITEGAYEYMFKGCTSLTAAPQMAATTVKAFCYQSMYQGCTTLTEAPVLPATQLATYCYQNMFNGCTALRTAPALPAQEMVTGCYTQMFNGCTSLNYIKVNFTDWRYFAAATDPTYKWVTSVSGTGEFICPETLPVIKDENHIPSKFTVSSAAGYMLTFDANGGKWADGSEEDVTISQAEIESIPHATKKGHMFTRWNTEPDGTGEDINLGNLPDEDETYYAQYDSIGVQLHKWQSNAIFLSITNLPAGTEEAVVKVVDGGASKTSTLELCKVDVGVYQLGFNKNDVKLHQGGVMDVTLYDEDANALGTVSIQIPYLVSSAVNSSTLGDTENADIWVLNGGKLTIDADRTCKTMMIAAGGKTVVPTGKTLTTDSLILRGGELSNGSYLFAYPQLCVNGSVVNASGKVNYQYMVGLQQNYTLALPGSVNVADVKYIDGTDATFGVYRYDGAIRAQGKSGWEEIWDPEVGGTAPNLEAGQGYTIYGVPMEEMGGKRRNYCYLDFPMTMDLSAGEIGASATGKTVSVTHAGMTDGKLNPGVTANNAGWNLVGNPYLTNFVGSSEEGFENGVIGQLEKDPETGEYDWVGDARYVVIPSDNGQSYEAMMVSEATLPAFKNFFIQVGKGDALSFVKTGRAESAPRRMRQDEQEVMAGMRISGNGMEDRVGLLIHSDYTEDYELNADLDKWPNQGLDMSAKVGKYSLCVAALSAERAAQPIALTIKATKAGAYTFALAEEWTKNISELSHLYLFDREENTYTDLLNSSYEVGLTAETHSGRFYLSAEGKTTPTDCEEMLQKGIVISSSNGRIHMDGMEGTARVKVFTLSGLCIFNETVTETCEVKAQAGVYVVEVEQDGERMTQNIIIP